MYLFFDTETTGIPKNYKAPANDLENWPRLVQLGYLMYSKTGKLIASGDYIVLPKGFSIPVEASKVHGITTEIAIQVGKEINIVLEEFYSLVERADFLVAHNMAFDEKIIGAELLRNKFQNIIEKKIRICTMLTTVDYCAIPGPYGNKWPKLSELHLKLFGSDFEGAHNAFADIEATSKCFWELINLKLINTNLLTMENLNQSQMAEKYFSEGKAMINKSDYETAILFYTKAIDISPEFSLAYLQRGFARKFTKDFSGAIKDFDKAIESKGLLNDAILGNFNLEQAYWNRGQSKGLKNDILGAIRDYDKVIELNPKFINAYLERSHTKIAIEDFQGAISDCNKVIEIDSKSQAAYFNRGIAKAHLMLHSNAIQDFDIALELDPNDIEAYCERAGLKTNIGDYIGSLKDSNKAIELNKSQNRPYLLRGITKFNMQDYDGAYRDLKQSSDFGNEQATQMINEYFEQS